MIAGATKLQCSDHKIANAEISNIVIFNSNSLLLFQRL